MSPKRLDREKPKSRIGLFALLLGVFALKLIVLIQLHGNPLIQPDAGLDTTAYATLADKVLAGDWALGPGLYYVSPFYIYFLAVCLAVFKSYTMLRVVQIALGTVSVGFIFEMARLWFSERAAWIAGVLAAFTGLFTFYEILILQSSVDAFLTSAALYALTRGLIPTTRSFQWLQALPRFPGFGPPGSSSPGPRAVSGSKTSGKSRTSGSSRTSETPEPEPPEPLAPLGRAEPSLAWCLLSGVIFGLQTLNRPNVLIAAVGITIVALGLRRVRLAAVLMAGLALGMSPVAIRNIVVSNEWTFVSSHGGLNFFIGNSEKATGFYQLVPGVSPNIGGQQKDVVRVASRALGHPVTDAEASDYFFGLGRTWVTEHPGAAAVLFARKLTYVFNAVHVPLPQSYPFYAYDLHTALRLYAVGPWLLGPLGLSGLLFCRPGQRASSIASRAQANASYLIWASFVPFYAVGVAVFFIADRYRLPLLVPLCVGAGALVDLGLSEVRSGRARSFIAPAVTTCALAVVVNWPLDVTEGRWLEGLRLVQQLAIHHQYEEAGSWASRLDADHPPNPGAAHYGLGAQLLQLNDPSRALPYFEEATRMDPGNAQADYAYGQALLRTRGAAAALPHLKRGFEAGIELPLGGFDYADALHDIGDLRGAAEAAKRVTLPENAGADILLKMGRLAFEAGQPAEAERFFRTAVEVEPDQASAHQQLGLNLLILERYEEAAHELSEAVRLDPKDPDSLAHLAYCEAKLGNSDGARMHAQAALAIDPSNQLARQILTLLRSSPDPR